MNTTRKTAAFVGAFFLISNATFIIGVLLIESMLSAPDSLTQLAAQRPQLVLGVLLELVNGLAYLGIAALMFPILRVRFESLALGYVIFRVLEFVMQIAGSLSPLILMSVGQELGSSGAAGLEAILLAQRVWASHMVSLTFGLGALLFYIMLLRTQLIPRFISIWGLIGAGLVLLNLLFDLFGVSLGVFSNLGILMLLNELFLGVWLIIKGFNPAAEISAASTVTQSRLAEQV
ncbi:MAG: DUF4386 domain-containing protein [Anaerolineales bacterium]|jgi:hypothetical protein